MTKGVVMHKPNKQKSKPAKPNANKQRGFAVVELLFTAATLGAAVLVAAMNSSKRPPLQGD